MRIWDERYRRDMRRYNLAVRLIGHEARTNTICTWTGFTEERVRSLYRAYLDLGRETDPVRHRGPSPRRISYFLRSPRLRAESAVAAVLCRLSGAVPAQPVRDATRTLPSIACGERVCNAFESYRAAVPDPRLTLEHLILLVFALASAQELALGHCANCDAAILVDLLGVDRRICELCREASAAPPIVWNTPAPTVSSLTLADGPDDRQRTLV